MFSLDSYKLKWIAIIGMALFHTIDAFYSILPMLIIYIFGAVGGLTFPIMGYFVVEGYKHTADIKKYLMRLFIFGVIAAPFHMLIYGFGLRLNIMFSIILCLITLMIYDKIKTKSLFWIFVLPIILVISMILTMDWVFIGVIVILLYYVIKNETARRVIPPIVGGVMWLGIASFSLVGIRMFESIGDYTGVEQVLAMWSGGVYSIAAAQVMIIGCIAAAILLKCYNGERGKRMKWLFYTFYPAHLAIISLVALAFGFITL